MTPARSPLDWLDPGSGRLLLVVGSGLVLLVAVPALVAPHYVWMLSALLLGFGFALFSVRRTLAILLVGTIVLPGTVLVMLVLPGGLRIQEGLLLAAFGFALIDVFYLRGLRLRTSALDRSVLAFLGLTLVSMAVGLIYQNSTSVILRDGRFFLYYSAFFLVTHFVEERAVVRLFLPWLLLASGLVVGVEYILEFLGAVDLSMGSRFARVGRLQGMILPAGFVVRRQPVHPRPPALWPPRPRRTIRAHGSGSRPDGGTGYVGGLRRRPCRRRMPAPSRPPGSSATEVWRTVALLVAILAFVWRPPLSFSSVSPERPLAPTPWSARAPSWTSSATCTCSAASPPTWSPSKRSERRPFLGSGQGTTIEVMTFNEEFMGFERTPTWTVDNLYLTLLLKMGIAGLVAFGWLGLKVLRLAFAVFRLQRGSPGQSFRRRRGVNAGGNGGPGGQATPPW